MSNPLSLKAGQMVGPGRFTLARELGRGGMGVVWLAQDTQLTERVALKFLPPEVAADPAALNDLRRETVRSHRLTHANILRTHDFHQQPDGVAFISMEYVDGPTLTVWRLEQPKQVLAWGQLAPLLQQLCAALEYAHGEGVIHRDLKPANVMLDSRGRVKLADFGIAAVVSDSMSRVSARPSTGGTLAYMSPQQLAGRPPSVTDDLYALGATLYELLTGRPPFYSGDLTHQILNVAAQPVDERLLDLGVDNPVPPGVAAMVMACLAKDPQKRPPNAKAVAAWAGLVEAPRSPEEQFAAQVGKPPRVEVVEAPAMPAVATPDLMSRRAKWQWVAIAAAAVLVVGLLGWALFHMTRGLARAGTYVSGTIAGETWTSKGSPYLVTGDVSVTQLEIRPAVEVRFLTNAVFEVAGILKAEGTAAQPIRFWTPNPAMGWKGIFFNQSQPGCSMTYCRVEGSTNSGIRIINSTPSLTGCVIANNTSPLSGGGVNANVGTGTLILDRCTITNNAVLVSVGNEGGGGVRISGNAQFLGCVISSNTNTASAVPSPGGGGLLCQDANCTLKNCTIAQNQMGGAPNAGAGGGVCVAPGNVTLENCLIVSNSVHVPGGNGAVFVHSGSARVINCTIVGNTPEGVGAIPGVASLFITNSILYFNNAGGQQLTLGPIWVAYSDVQNGAATNGNITSNPVLRPDTLELLPGSPCIDAGSPDPAYNDTSFPPSKGGPRNDIGAYGGPGASGWLAGEAHQVTAAPQHQPSAVAQPGWERLFFDNFDRGNADGWSLVPGWKVEKDGDNFVLSGTGHAFSASAGSPSWSDYRLKLKTKLLKAGNGTHVNFRVTQNGSNRYFVHIHPGGVSLHKMVNGQVFQNLALTNFTVVEGLWHTVELVAEGSHLRLDLDGVNDIVFTDTRDPLLQGSFSLETLPNSYVFFDDVEVRGKTSPALRTQSQIGGPASAGVDKPVSPQPGTAPPAPARVTNLRPFSTKAADAAKLPAGFPQGLVLYYNFDSPPTNGVVLDLSSSGNHGRATGVEWTAQGQRGGAFQFTGMNSAVRVPNHSSLNPEEITLAAWIKSNRREGGWARIFDKNVSHGYALCVAADWQYVKSAGKLHWQIRSEGREAVTLSDQVIADGRWHHVAATHDGREIHLYVDGQLQTKEAAILRQWRGRFPENDSDLTIGGDLAGAGFIGTIDEPMIFNRALSADEVHLLHQWSNRSAPVVGEGLTRAEGSSQRRWTNRLGMVFVPVPGTEVKFCIWETRVRDFETFVRETGYDATAGMCTFGADGWKPRGNSWRSPGFPQTPDHPVCGVNWEDAKAFCAWLSKKDGRTYRLPTDLEWSKAAGITAPESGDTPQERGGKIKEVYPWGNAMPPMVNGRPAGNYAGEEVKDANWPNFMDVIAGYRDGYARTAPVGSFPSNAFGLYDLGGNVWEWCEDIYGSSDRVMRGGAWCNGTPDLLLSSFRHSFTPANRYDSVGFRCVLALGELSSPPGAKLVPSSLSVPAIALLTDTSPLTTARFLHTSTLLPNGKVLIVGGYYNNDGTLPSAELHDPATSTWMVTGALTSSRGHHRATLLPNGKVLVAGGNNTNGSVSSAECYDPVSGTWKTTGLMTTARAGASATLLPNGKALVAGGGSKSAHGNYSFLSGAELYDPVGGTWTAAGATTTARAIHTAVLLTNGKVLVTGGFAANRVRLSSAGLFDPATGKWMGTGSMSNARVFHSATLLPNGKVLVAGGENDGGQLSSMELYDPATGTWTNTVAMATARDYHTATLLPNGKVLLAGGRNSSGSLSGVELFNPAPEP
jgi:hypothetical protein